jgi:hypothetical protein
MSDPLSIHAGSPVLGTGEITAPSRSAPPEVAPAAKPVPLFLNPSFKFDSEVGLVVIGFHDDSGKMTSSIPSQRQLAAYRSGQAPVPGERAPKTAADGKTSAG